MRGNLVITLFIDTSTEYLTVALIKDDKVLNESTNRNILKEKEE